VGVNAPQHAPSAILISCQLLCLFFCSSPQCVRSALPGTSTTFSAWQEERQKNKTMSITTNYNTPIIYHTNTAFCDWQEELEELEAEHL
jgi:hypothetical protein